MGLPNATKTAANVKGPARAATKLAGIKRTNLIEGCEAPMERAAIARASMAR